MTSPCQDIWIRHVVNNRMDLSVVVFDNADHFDIEFQQAVYQYARSVYERAVCLVVLPITDRTSWQLSKHGALQSFEHEALFLPTPPTDEIIRKRIDFIQQRIDTERERPDDRYFVQRGISLRLEDLTGFARSLQRVFLQTSNTSRWIDPVAVDLSPFCLVDRCHRVVHPAAKKCFLRR